MSKFEEYKSKKRQSATMGKKANIGLVGPLFGVAILVVVIASAAIPLINAIDTTGWSATDILLLKLIPTLLLVAIVMAVVRYM